MRPSSAPSSISVTVSPARSGTEAPPGLGEARPHGGLGDRLIARQDVGQRAHVAGALHVVLSPQRIDPSAGDAQVAQQELEIRAGERVVGAARVLGDAHREQQRARPMLPEDAGSAADVGGADTGDRRRPLGCGVLHTVGEGLEALRARRDKGRIHPAAGDQHVRQRVEQRHVGARPQPQVEHGRLHDGDVAGIGHHDG
jgi:hypothetical protein